MQIFPYLHHTVEDFCSELKKQTNRKNQDSCFLWVQYKHSFKYPLQFVSPSSRCIAGWCECPNAVTEGLKDDPLRGLDGVPLPPPWQRPIEKGVINSFWNVISKGVEGPPSSLLEQSVGGKCETKNKNKIWEKKQTKNRSRKRLSNLKKLSVHTHTLYYNPLGFSCLKEKHCLTIL